jgi:hypothetical protein
MKEKDFDSTWKLRSRITEQELPVAAFARGGPGNFLRISSG